MCRFLGMAHRQPPRATSTMPNRLPWLCRGSAHNTPRASTSPKTRSILTSWPGPITACIHKAKQTTADADIIRLAHLTLDFDPVRKPGISSTDAELAQALATRDEFIQFVTAELGWPEPVVCMMSGNGGQATWRIDFPLTTRAPPWCRPSSRPPARCSARQPCRWTRRSAIRAASSSCRGRSLPKAMPFLIARTGAPTATFTQRQGSSQRRSCGHSWHSHREPPPPTRPTNGRTPYLGAGGPTYDIPALLDAAGIGFREHDKGWARVYELDRCLSSDDHNDGAAIFQFPSGAVAYQLFPQPLRWRHLAAT